MLDFIILLALGVWVAFASAPAANAKPAAAETAPAAKAKTAIESRLSKVLPQRISSATPGQSLLLT